MCVKLDSRVREYQLYPDARRQGLLLFVLWEHILTSDFLAMTVSLALVRTAVTREMRLVSVILMSTWVMSPLLSIGRTFLLYPSIRSLKSSPSRFTADAGVKTKWKHCAMSCVQRDWNEKSFHKMLNLLWYSAFKCELDIWNTTSSLLSKWLCEEQWLQLSI